MRRVLTLARQVRLRLCIEQVNSLSALNLVKHFSQTGSQVFARPTESLLAQLREDQALEAVEDVIISLHPSSSVKITWIGLLPGPPRSEPRHMNLIRAEPSAARGRRRDRRPEVVSSQYREAGFSLLGSSQYLRSISLTVLSARM